MPKPIITREEVNDALRRQLATEGRSEVDPDSLTEQDRFMLAMRRIVSYKKNATRNHPESTD